MINVENIFSVFVKSVNNCYELLGQKFLFSVQYKREESHSRGQNSRWDERPVWSVFGVTQQSPYLQQLVP